MSFPDLFERFPQDEYLGRRGLIPGAAGNNPVVDRLHDLVLELIAKLDDGARPVRVLAISGSLRRASSNTALVEAAVTVAASHVEVSPYRDLARIPPFNPDLEEEMIEAVYGFRAALDSSDAVLISSPEYAHGVSGVLKNALDWVVGSGELIDKPIALINASGRATLAHAALKETLKTMSARVIEEASIVVPLDGRAWDANAIAADADLSTALGDAIAALAHSVRLGK